MAPRCFRWNRKQKGVDSEKDKEMAGGKLPLFAAQREERARGEELLIKMADEKQLADL